MTVVNGLKTHYYPNGKIGDTDDIQFGVHSLNIPNILINN